MDFGLWKAIREGMRRIRLAGLRRTKALLFGDSLHAPQGRFRLAVEHRDGRKEIICDHNLVVSNGRHLLAMLLAGKTSCHITHAAIGNSSDPETADDSRLANQFSVPVTASVEGNIARFQFAIDYGDANGMDIHEFGLAAWEEMPTGATEGDATPLGGVTNVNGETYILFSRRMRQQPLAKTADIRITGEWEVTL